MKNREMKNRHTLSGFALLSVVGVMAVAMALVLAGLQINQSNATATAWDSHDLQADHLLSSGLRYAVLSIVSPRAEVVAQAIPQQYLVYRNALADVTIRIENEAGRIGLESAAPELLDASLRVIGVGPVELIRIKQVLADSVLSEADTEETQNRKFRVLMSILQEMGIDREAIWRVATLGNSQLGINPDLAPPEVLSVVPGLSSAEQQHILARREQATHPIRSESVIDGFDFGVKNQYFNESVSSYYRVKSELVLGDQRFLKTWIIKIVNQPEHMYEVFAQW